jgi:ketosteroid isomerase-like protein
MSEENVETVRSMLSAWAAGNFEEALTYFNPDVVWDNRTLPEGWITHGTNEMQQALRSWLGTWSKHFATFDEYIDAGNNVVVVGTERGQGEGKRDRGRSAVGHRLHIHGREDRSRQELQEQKGSTRSRRAVGIAALDEKQLFGHGRFA